MELPAPTPSSTGWMPLSQQNTGNVGAGASVFSAFGPSNGTDGTEFSSRGGIAPYGGTIRNLRIRNAGAMIASDGIRITVRKNGVDTALVLTWAALDAASTEKTDLVNVVSFVAGDRLTVKIENLSVIGGNNGGFYGCAEIRPL